MSARFRLMKWNVAIKPKKHIFLIVRNGKKKKTKKIKRIWQQQRKKSRKCEQKRNRNCSDLLLSSSAPHRVFFFFRCCIFLACLVQFNVFMVCISFGACCETHGLLPFISHSLTLSFPILLTTRPLCCELTQMSLTFFVLKNTRKKNAKILISTFVRMHLN